jgi:hypothetical protein
MATCTPNTMQRTIVCISRRHPLASMAVVCYPSAPQIKSSRHSRQPRATDWRFLDAGRLSARHRCHCRHPKTSTEAENLVENLLRDTRFSSGRTRIGPNSTQPACLVPLAQRAVRPEKDRRVAAFAVSFGDRFDSGLSAWSHWVCNVAGGSKVLESGVHGLLRCRLIELLTVGSTREPDL